MSELANAQSRQPKLRWQLLTTVSALTLIGFCGITRAAETDGDGPTIWIELGGQFNRLQESQETFLPPIMDERPSIFSPSQKFERLPLYSIDETGKLMFEPQGTDWVLSASVMYGRSVSHPHVHQQTAPKNAYLLVGGVPYTGTAIPPAIAVRAKFADTVSHNSESHSIVDFRVGRDVGLGMLGGKDGESVLSLGVRFAQFSSQSDTILKSDPDWHWAYLTFYHIASLPRSAFHSNAASMEASRSFHGFGPSLSWNASAPVAGNSETGDLAVNWGINAALLFGRQKASTQHQSAGLYGHNINVNRQTITHYPSHTGASVRSHTATIPNIGGFAGATYRIENFKVSVGYRADFFFGAIDGGIDARKSYDRNFYGPFATISIGLGG